MLVQISAMLMGTHIESDSRVLEMNAGGRLFLARLPESNESISLQMDSQLTLTGVYVGKNMAWSEAEKPGGFELLLNSPSQLKVLSKPSWWTPRRLLIIVGLLLAVLALSAIWISQLHRLVDQRTRELHKETREREIAEREQALETERSRIARDLHDDLGSSLTEISVLASKGQRIGTLNDLRVLFRAISSKARGLVSALDIIVWAVDPKDNSLESVADYLGDFANEYLSHSGIACRFDIPVALPSIVLEGRSRHGLLLAVKETLNNIERHAQATEVEFRMTCSGGLLKIIITDNGKGFEKKTKRGGNGLRNLPLRLSKLGGRYEIDSSMGKGTIVTIGLNVFPLAEAISGAP
jgi:signal transduction histidine kinase